MTDETTGDEPSDEAPSDDAPPEEGEGHPRGTLVLSGLFIVLMAATWLFMYFTLLARS